MAEITRELIMEAAAKAEKLTGAPMQPLQYGPAPRTNYDEAALEAMRKAVDAGINAIQGTDAARRHHNQGPNRKARRAAGKKR